MKSFQFLAFFILLHLIFSCTGFNRGKEEINIKNEIFSKTFLFSSKNPAIITVSFKLNSDNISINNNRKIPFFEFVLNNELVSSNDNIWLFQNHDTREMKNGGTEHTLVFEGAKGKVEGIQVKLYEQIFPNSTLMREKLELVSKGKTFRLNKLDGELHFKFPSYSINNEDNLDIESTEIRIATWEKNHITFGDKRKGNHMYYPDIITGPVTQEKQISKGPFSIVSNGRISWLTAYEHASQDDLNGLLKKQISGTGNLINDAMQGVTGNFNFHIDKEDFLFLGITNQNSNEDLNISVEMFRGGYLDGEIIDKDHSYSTVWTATGFYKGSDLNEGKAMIRNYLFNQICENPAPRIPEYYYNTWGMQREDRNKPLRGILTYERIYEEIENAVQLGVDIFVLDDGWENKQGEWFTNEERFPEGLAPIKEKLDQHGLKMGLWFSPMGIDTSAQRYNEHQEWVIKDSDGSPILAQWNHPAFDFVSGFFDVFIDDCKKLIDQGCRFMKWDAINTFYSRLPDLEHGSDTYSEQEIRARYEYLLPIYVTRAMEILTDYEPELLIEMDLTEARRVMVGLAPLSQGKVFWMNNGASWYNDYTTFRTKSMRTIASEFAGIIPLELFTYANYPQNVDGNMKYNVANSLLAGHGFWGNLKLMSNEERNWVGSQVRISKEVLPFLVDVNPLVIGKVGDSPEIYSIVNENEGAGQIIVFSEEPFKKEFSAPLKAEKVLGVINHPYKLEEDRIKLTFQGTEKESSAAVFILPNKNSGICLRSSTSSLTNIKFQKNQFEYNVVEPGIQLIRWDKKLGPPEFSDSDNFDFSFVESSEFYSITVDVKKDNSRILIYSEK